MGGEHLRDGDGNGKEAFALLGAARSRSKASLDSPDRRHAHEKGAANRCSAFPSRRMVVHVASQSISDELKSRHGSHGLGLRHERMRARHVSPWDRASTVRRHGGGAAA